MITASYAKHKGWSLKKINLIVEGNLDVTYFNLANKKYLLKNGKSLVGDDLSIFAVGTGNLGGTLGIVDELPTLIKIAAVDLDQNGKRKHRFAALFDFDDHGRDAAQKLPRINRAVVMWQDMFFLQRSLPRRSRESKPLCDHVEAENSAYQRLDCEIEDLIDQTLVDLFVSEQLRIAKPKRSIANGFHINWSQDEKHALIRFVTAHCTLDEINGLVETLKSLRFYLGLPPDGACPT